MTISCTHTHESHFMILLTGRRVHLYNIHRVWLICLIFFNFFSLLLVSCIQPQICVHFVNIMLVISDAFAKCKCYTQRGFVVVILKMETNYWRKKLSRKITNNSNSKKRAKLTRAAHENKDKYFGWNRQSCAYNQINVVIEWCIFRGGLCLDFM